MHQAVVVWAELHEVFQRSGAAISPVLDVVTVQVPGCGAAGKATALIARSKRTV